MVRRHWRLQQRGPSNGEYRKGGRRVIGRMLELYRKDGGMRVNILLFLRAVES